MTSFIAGQLRDPLGYGAAAGNELPASPLLQVTNTMVHVGGIVGPVIDSFSWVLNLLDYFSFKKGITSLLKKLGVPYALIPLLLQRP